MPGNTIVCRDFYTNVLVMSFEAKYTNRNTNLREEIYLLIQTLVTLLFYFHNFKWIDD